MEYVGTLVVKLHHYFKDMTIEVRLHEAPGDFKHYKIHHDVIENGRARSVTDGHKYMHLENAMDAVKDLIDDGIKSGLFRG